MKLLLTICMALGILAACGDPADRSDRREDDSVYTNDPVAPADTANRRDTSSYENRPSQPIQPQ